MDKSTFSEHDICVKFITTALHKAVWDEMLQIREEVSFTKGRIFVRGKIPQNTLDYLDWPILPVAPSQGSGG